eukprot:Skav204551  [mRNA]  locus=scaffold3346:156314:162265:- [translate_table: standard]
MEDAEMDAETSPTFADVSLIIAACAGKSGHCGIAYVDLEETERILYVADVMDPEFAQLDRLKQQLLGDRETRPVGLCVLPMRSPQELVACAERSVAQGSEGSEDRFPTALVKAADFAVEGARRCLAQLWTQLEPSAGGAAEAAAGCRGAADAAAAGRTRGRSGALVQRWAWDMGENQGVRQLHRELRMMQDLPRLLARM